MKIQSVRDLPSDSAKEPSRFSLSIVVHSSSLPCPRPWSLFIHHYVWHTGGFWWARQCSDLARGAAAAAIPCHHQGRAIHRHQVDARQTRVVLLNENPTGGLSLLLSEKLAQARRKNNEKFCMPQRTIDEDT